MDHAHTDLNPALVVDENPMAEVEWSRVSRRRAQRPVLTSRHLPTLRFVRFYPSVKIEL